MSRTVRSPLLTAWRLLSSRSPLLQLKTNAVAMSAPAATSAQPTPASSMSSPSASASSTVNPPHVPECPRFKTIAVGDRLYRQQIIPSPAGLSSSFHSSPTASSPTTPAARPPGTSSAASASHPLPLDESLLPLVNEVRDDAGALLYRLTVDIQYACMLSSMSRMQRRAVEDIEQQHLTNILLPTKTPHSHTIVVTGADRESIVYSKLAIDRLISTLIADCPYTHFLSLPLPSFHSSLDRFRSAVLAAYPDAPGLDSSIFVRPTSFHFTVAMLTLPTIHHVQRAATALTSLAAPMSDGLSIRLRGLAVMNDKPEAAHVLYIQPDEPSQQRLTDLADLLIDGMRQAGVLSDSDVRKQRLVWRDRATGDEKVNVKWHATIINTKHRGRALHESDATAAAQTDGGGWKSGGRKGHGGSKRQAADVSGIIAQYVDVDWGEGTISACELSTLSWDSKTNYYPCEGRLLL